MIVIDVKGEIINGNQAAMMRQWFGESDTEFSIDSVREAVNRGEDGDEILLNIDSYGGDIEAALQIYDYLRLTGRTIYSNIMGDASSAASILLLAAEKKNRSANAHASAVLHYTSGGTYGKVEDVESLAKDMTHFNAEIAKVYVERTGLSAKRVDELLSKDERHFAPELMSMGFISSINKYTTAAAVALGAQKEMYTRRIAAMAERMESKPKQVKQNEIQTLLTIFNQYGKTN